jgi:Ribonuclease toxin, BrnT, of type II toxin-antitoxin system
MEDGQGPEERDDIHGIEFEWYPSKAERNLRKHGVSFEEAATIFGDRRLLTVPVSMKNDTWQSGDLNKDGSSRWYLPVAMSESD